MEPPPELVKQLQERTALSAAKCRLLLIETKGDINKAVQLAHERTRNQTW